MSTTQNIAPTALKLRWRRLSDVEPESVKYLQPGRIPFGKLTLLVGDPGIGKSRMTLDLAARVSTGVEWPTGGRAPLGNVIVLSAEDGVADTIRPSVDTFGGDPSHVFVVDATVDASGGERGLSLVKDLIALEALIRETEARLVIVDPLDAYLGETDTFRSSDVRGVLAPLATLADKLGVAIVAVMHLTKNNERAAIYRASGSIGFVAAARAVFAVAKDPDDDERRLVLSVKFNIGPKPPALAFRIADGQPKWERGPVDANVDQVLRGPGAGDGDTGGSSKTERAVVSLRDVLRDGPVPVEQLREWAKAEGISWRTLQTAKGKLDVRSERQGGVGSEGRWVWTLKTVRIKQAIAQGDAGLLPDAINYKEVEQILRELEKLTDTDLSVSAQEYEAEAR